MKVLKAGDKQAWGITVICNGAGNSEKDSSCGAELMVEEGDVFSTQQGGYDGSGDTCYTIECPCCKTWTDIPSSRLPGFIKDRARQNKRYPSDRGKERRGYGD